MWPCSWILPNVLQLTWQIHFCIAWFWRDSHCCELHLEPIAPSNPSVAPALDPLLRPPSCRYFHIYAAESINTSCWRVSYLLRLFHNQHHLHHSTIRNNQQFVNMKSILSFLAFSVLSTFTDATSLERRADTVSNSKTPPVTVKGNGMLSRWTHRVRPKRG